jgi:hypothetical protein
MPAADTGKGGRATAAGTVFAWRTRGYGLMISRLRKLNCATGVRAESAEFSRRPASGINCGRSEYRIAAKRFALASRPCKGSVVPGENPISGALDEAQVY